MLRLPGKMIRRSLKIFLNFVLTPEARMPASIFTTKNKIMMIVDMVMQTLVTTSLTYENTMYPIM